jgi:Na+-transporting methylmalonyl-CoA/oxaloacetate decarboxylase gamma subunit
MEHLIMAVTLLVLLLLAYLLWARFSHPRRWPWSHEKEKTKTKDTLYMRQDDDDDEEGGHAVVHHNRFMENFGSAILIALVVGLFIVLIYYAIKLDMKRYEIAGDAINKGNTGVAVAALAPEIGSGIGDALEGLMGSRYK